MTYDKLIESISMMLENDKIEKKGLTLVYSLTEEEHLNLNLELYYKTNQEDDFKPEDEFEVEIGGILIKFVKKV